VKPVCRASRLPSRLFKLESEQAGLQLVDSDVVGPVNPVSHDGKRYVVTLIADNTNFLPVYLLSSTAEVFNAFKEYEAMAKTHLNVKGISRFGCDNGRVPF